MATRKRRQAALKPIPPRYWGEETERPCAGRVGEPHTHPRIPVLMPPHDEAGFRPSYWPPSAAARRDALERGYPFHLFDRSGGWAITVEEVYCLEMSWAGEGEDYGQPE